MGKGRVLQRAILNHYEPGCMWSWEGGSRERPDRGRGMLGSWFRQLRDQTLSKTRGQHPQTDTRTHTHSLKFLTYTA